MGVKYSASHKQLPPSSPSTGRLFLGVGKLDQKLELNALMFPLTAKTFKGSMYGGAEFKVDFPKYLELYKRGKLDLDRMVTNTYTIDEAVQAFEDLEAGKNARGVIVYD